jgi:tetratricopeptide (TPR) repeat protein
MNLLFRFCAALIGATLLCGPTLHGREKWLYASTEHFDVLTSSRESEARDLIEQLEQFRTTFLAIVRTRIVHEPRATVVIFRSDHDFDPYKPLYKGKPKSLAGVFQGGRDEVMIGLSTEREFDRTLRTIFHEYVHLLMHAQGFRLPPWLNEGLAQLNSTMVIDRREIRRGDPIPHHLILLNRNQLMPLGDLFAVTHASPEYNESDLRGLFYAQSWALLHYWLCGDKKDNAANFGKFIGLLQGGKIAPEECMRTAFGMGFAEMETALERYVRSGRYLMVTYKRSPDDVPPAIAFRPATDFERDLALTNLKWRLQHNGDATYKFLELSEREPTSPRPLEILGTIAQRSGDRATALSYWKRAAALGSKNAYIYQELADATLDGYMRGVSSRFRFSAETSAELRGWLDQALTLNPDYVDAWDRLVLTEAFSEKVRASVINPLIAKHRDGPMRPRFLVGVGFLSLRAGNLKTAGELADVVLAHPAVLESVKRRSAGPRSPTISGPTRMPGASPPGAPAKPRSWFETTESYGDVYSLARQLKVSTERAAARKREAEAEPADTAAPEAAP